LKSRPAVVSWCLYDFANSFYAAVIIATVWAAYYTDVIVGNAAGVGDLWWGRVVSLSMLLVAATSPIMGAMADSAALRKKLLIVYTLLSVTGTALLATVQPGMILYGFILTLAANFGFEGAMVFYNSYLPDLAPPERQGRLSGWGFATGYAGSILGLLGALPAVNAGHFDLAFLYVAASFLIFAMPAFLWLPPDPPASARIGATAKTGLINTGRTLKAIVRQPKLRRFMLAYFIYIDGVNTVIYFSSIFAVHTLQLAMSEMIWVFVVVQCTALIGAYVWAHPTDRLGPKRVVAIMIVQWAAVVIGAYFVADKVQFFLLAAVAGTGLGAIQAASRAFMSRLIPAGHEGEYFGFYALCGKTASIFGPLVFGTVSAVSGGNQRLAVLSVLPFFVIGGLILSGVRAGGPEPATNQVT